MNSKGDLMADSTTHHGALMDGIYRRQRLIYDVTRKYYLLGRDHLIDQMHPEPSAHILEIACGTGRNLDLIERRYPGRVLYGVDISSEMLNNARNKLGTRARFAQGDACAFDPETLFGQARFDHIVMSYSLSMIPDWQAAIAEALRHLQPGGTLHIVDFGDQARLPRWFKAGLRNWLARFHVASRDGLADVICAQTGVEVTFLPLYRGYAQYARVTKSPA